VVPLSTELLKSAKRRILEAAGSEIRRSDLSLSVRKLRPGDGLLRLRQLKKIRKGSAAAAAAAADGLSFYDLGVVRLSTRRSVVSFPALNPSEDGIRGGEASLFRIRKIDSGRNPEKKVLSVCGNANPSIPCLIYSYSVLFLSIPSSYLTSPKLTLSGTMSLY
jgi:hypothetical protein